MVIVRFHATPAPDKARGGSRKLLNDMIVLPGIPLAIWRGVSDRLLVVDDDEDVRRVYQAHFARAGFEVEGAATFQEAAERLSSSVFHAVIADISLTPSVGSEGLAIAAYLRHLNREPTPVLVLTAYGEPEKAAAAARLAVDAFLHKPVSLVWLEGLLRSRIDERRGRPGGSDSDSGLEPVAAAV